MRSLWKEPLVHFVLAGAVLFALSALSPDRNAALPEEIRVTEGRIQNLAAMFEKVWRRPPTPDELDGLIQEHVREEMLYREGLAMGLDRDDTVIRRRIRQKVEFLLDDEVEEAAPSEEELQAFLAAHPDLFRIPPRYSFRQILLNESLAGDDPATRAERLLARLDDPDVDASELGDRSLLAHAYSDLRENQAAQFFGAGFAEAMAELPVGRWSGPIPSGYGHHLVFVERVTPSRMPALEEMKVQVMREWVHARRNEAREAFYQRIETQYRVIIERPAPGAAAEG